MNEETYNSIMESIQETKDYYENLNVNSKILLVDGMNTFMRCFVKSPALDTDGYHIGGVVGFLKSVGYALKKLKPTRCIVVFDGKNGSKRRRKIYPDYKKGRKPKRNYNRAYDDGLEDPEESMVRQMRELADYLKILPVNVVSIDSIEADDSIAYISQQIFNDEDQSVYIMSSDKDFLQLVDERVKVWSPVKQKIYSEEKVEEEYGYPPNNYLIKRIIEGDDSDNIAGIKGIGPKRTEKILGDFLKSKKHRKFYEVIEYARENKNESNTYERLLDNKDIIKRNWKLMQLFEVDIPVQKKMKITDIVEEEISSFEKGKFKKAVVKDGIASSLPSLQQWLSDTFEKLDRFSGE